MRLWYSAMMLLIGYFIYQSFQFGDDFMSFLPMIILFIIFKLLFIVRTFRKRRKKFKKKMRKEMTKNGVFN